MYLFSSPTSASNNKYSVSNEAAHLISIQQILDHSLEDYKFRRMQVLHMSQLNVFILLAYSSNLSDAKKTKCHTPGKKKSLFPTCVHLLLYKSELATLSDEWAKQKELISSTDMSVWKRTVQFVQS